MKKNVFRFMRKFINTKVKAMDGSGTGIGNPDGISRERRITFLKPVMDK